MLAVGGLLGGTRIQRTCFQLWCSREESDAYQAFSELRSAGAGGRIDIRSAVIVSRTADGRPHVSEAEDQVIGSGTTGGGLIGMLVGILGGPLGMLLGLGAGALIGGAVDLNRAGRTHGLLGNMSRLVPPGVTAVAGEIDEVGARGAGRDRRILGRGGATLPSGAGSGGVGGR